MQTHLTDVVSISKKESFTYRSFEYLFMLCLCVSERALCVYVPVPELRARGVIQQVFPLHEQRILGQLMKSWVQAVCEKQPLG